MPTPCVYPEIAAPVASHRWRGALLAMALTVTGLACSSKAEPRKQVETECEPAPKVLQTRKLVAEGRRLLKGDVAGAEERFQQAVALDPDYVDAYVGLGEARAKRENWGKLADAMTKATKLAPTWAPYWERLGFALRMDSIRGGESLDGAKQAYARCTTEDTNLAACWNGLGLVQAQQGDLAAMQSLTTAVLRDPSQGDYYADLAELYDRLGHYRQTKMVAAAGMSRAKPGSDTAWKLRLHRAAGHAALTLGDPTDAVTQLEAAKALSKGEPSEYDVLFLLGMAYVRANKSALGVDHLKGFRARACSGSRASQFRVQCTVAEQELEHLSGDGEKEP